MPRLAVLPACLLGLAGTFGCTGDLGSATPGSPDAAADAAGPCPPLMGLADGVCVDLYEAALEEQQADGASVAASPYLVVGARVVRARPGVDRRDWRIVDGSGVGRCRCAIAARGQRDRERGGGKRGHRASRVRRVAASSPAARPDHLPVIPC